MRQNDAMRQRFDEIPAISASGGDWSFVKNGSRAEPTNGFNGEVPSANAR
jgi:hypothetical protein